MKTMLFCFLVGILSQTISGEEFDKSTTHPPPPRPYAFGYAAGRAPGHIDRTHSEISDGFGTVQGSFSYVDPSNKIRTVDYIADKQGFHPTLNFEPTDTKAVSAAKEKHHRLYASIAQKHDEGVNSEHNVPRDTQSVVRAKIDHMQRFEHIARLPPGTVIVPRDTPAGERAAEKHLLLFDRIAADHARIQAERKHDDDLINEEKNFESHRQY